MDETFTLLPLYMDPQTKIISAPSLKSDIALTTELEALNNIHQSLKGLNTPHAVPPPPLPLDPKRSAAIQKMREQGNTAMSKRGGDETASLQEANKLYSYAIDMALKRPSWEPSQIVRDEVSILLSNRAQAHIGLQQWPEAVVDAMTSVELKPSPGQGKAWWRRGRALMEMGRLTEALEWANKGLEVESSGDGANDLRDMKKKIEERIEEGKRSGENGSWDHV